MSNEEKTEDSTNAPPTEVPVRQVRYKTTPLPLSQMIPMSFVVLNESLCGTMLLPFVGFFVSHLQGIDPDEAGYTSGLIVSVFMFGQVFSAQIWGKISDLYGRRFPLVSGLFTSGLFMLGFGLSTNLWMATFFRFLQGSFNGNILVAKTMMADITDKTNEAKGFSLISLVNGVGFLIGPALGGLLYDPSNSDSLEWVGISKTGIFATHPALLPSIAIFLYSIVGMLACTFFVKESNPKAKPLPHMLKLLYPCMWREAEEFVHPPLVEIFDEAGDQSNNDTEGVVITRGDSVMVDDSFRERSFFMALSSPCAMEDARFFDSLISDELLGRGGSRSRGSSTHNTPRQSATATAKGSFAGRSENTPLPRREASSSSYTNRKAREAVEGEEGQEGADKSAAQQEQLCEDAEEHKGGSRAAAADREGSRTETPSTEEDGDGQEEVVTKFGYREAFGRPYTRFMLLQYIIISGSDMAFRECFPLLAIASPMNHGMDLEADVVGYILLFNSVPSFASNYLFHKVCRRYTDKMAMFRVGAFFCAVFVVIFGLSSYLTYMPARFFLVVLCTSAVRFFCSWCYTLNTMCTARSAPPGHVGSIMGINQSSGALARGIAPIVAAPLFAWSLKDEHYFPFDQVLVFFIAGILFLVVSVRSYKIRTNAEGALELVNSS